MRIKLLIAALLFSVFSFGQVSMVTKDTTINGRPAIITYDQNNLTDSVECIMFFPGQGEVNAGVVSGLRKYGPHYYIDSLHTWDGSVVLGNGTHHPVFVSWLPLAGSFNFNPSTVKPALDIIRTRFRVKQRSFFVTGLSEGGQFCDGQATYQPNAGNHTYNLNIAASMSVEGNPAKPVFDGTPAYYFNYTQWIAANLTAKYLCFDQNADGGRDLVTRSQKMDSVRANSAIRYVTNFNGGVHGSFEKFYQPDTIWKTTTTGVVSVPQGTAINMTVYQWLLRQGDTTMGPPANVPPTANAGTDQIITLPASTGTLNGKGSFGNNGATITTYAWTKVAGPSTFTITNAAADSTSATGLVQGTYQFKLTVTDNHSQTGVDTVQIVVLPMANIPPVANAGPDTAITQPSDSVIFHGSGTDADGTVVGYAWTLASGGTNNILSPSSAVTKVTGLVAGIYKFVLTVTDNQGATGTDTIQVTVNSNTTGTEKTSQVSITRHQVSYDTTWQRWKTDSSLTFSLRRTDGFNDGWQTSLSGQLDTVKDNGSTYGNGQSNLLVPRGALREVSFSSIKLTLTISGLNPVKLYTIRMGGSRVGTTQVNYAVYKSLQTTDTALVKTTANNFTTEALFSNVAPTSGGIITMTGQPAVGYAAVYLNYFVVREQGSAENTAPSAFAGPDQGITLPLDSVLLQGAATDPNQSDTIHYHWNVTGPFAAVVANPDSLTTKVTKLDSPGVYTATLTVTDNHGAIGVDQMTINVASGSGPVIITPSKPYITVSRSQFNGYGPTQTRDTTFATLSCQTSTNTQSVRWDLVGGPAGVTFTARSSAATQAYDLIPGEYLFKVTGFSLTDSASTTVQVRCVDRQTQNEHGCRVGSPVTHLLSPTSTTQLVKQNLYQQQAAIGDTILGGDTVSIPRNPLNGGVYTNLTIGGVSGGRGCPVYIKPKDTTVDISGPVRLGFGTDSSMLSYCNVDGRLNPLGIKYGFALTYPTLSTNSGLAMFLGAYDSLMGWYIKNTATGFFVKNDQDSTRDVTQWNHIRWYGMVEAYDFIDNTFNGEGAYNGNTDPNGLHNNSTSGIPSTRMDTFTVYRCLFRGTFRDGSQISTAEVIYQLENWFYNIGTNNEATQRFTADAGGAYKTKFLGNFGYLVRDGFGDLSHGDNEVAYNYSGRPRTFNVGGLSAGFQYFPEAFGFMTGSSLLEYKLQDSGRVNLHDNIVDGPELGAYGIRIYDPRIAISKNTPSTASNNFLVDTLGQTLAQLVQNVSGSQYNTNNLLFTSQPLQVVDLSTQAIGPSFKLYWPADGTSQTFTSSLAAYQWYHDKLAPASNCNCFPGKRGYRNQFIKQ